MLEVPVVLVVVQFNPVVGNLKIISREAVLIHICRLKPEVHQTK